MLLFSDIPQNTVHKWTPEKGLETYLKPSGYTGATPRGGELGSNALILSREGKLILCQHGDRRLARMDAPLDRPDSVFITLAGNYQGRKFNSPNDVVMRSNGDLFFTDPPYGMEQRENDPVRELPFHGVFKVSVNGTVSLLTDSITRPNGIAFTPDEKTLIIANSDPQKAVWYMFDIGPNDSLVNPRILRDVTAEAKTENGLPDGMKIDRRGNIFATGPGGVWIFNKFGQLLGKIKVPVSASNCALAEEDRVLYITADKYVLRVKMRQEESPL
jgi:gluconolactonase